ncbi:hypothetical protein [Paenibacillus lutrae]|uniref:Uncharacterized protein n=1 Tax=Paenibacillus lutrae TaxID=2078573 RepID=A0A7X3FHY0_9BACL|nr:hypothetical protein [Paenibacillus lutrae]MVO99927.1 hypothetical protein [Paenibacillus lutrae]
MMRFLLYILVISASYFPGKLLGTLAQLPFHKEVFNHREEFYDPTAVIYFFIAVPVYITLLCIRRILDFTSAVSDALTLSLFSLIGSGLLVPYFMYFGIFWDPGYYFSPDILRFLLFFTGTGLSFAIGSWAAEKVLHRQSST